MTSREDLRRDGTGLRNRLFGPEAGTHFVPNYAELRAELAFGVVWNRPGLALPDRMIAALAALCVDAIHLIYPTLAIFRPDLPDGRATAKNRAVA